MDQTDSTNFSSLMSRLCRHYRVEASSTLYRDYWNELRDLDFENIKLAIDKAIRQERYWPVIAVIRQLAGDTFDKEKIDDKARLAWQYLLDEIRYKGIYQSPDFTHDKAISIATKEVGGWLYLNRASMDEVQYRLKPQFIAAYKTAAKRDDLNYDIHHRGLHDRLQNTSEKKAGLKSISDTTKKIVNKSEEMKKRQNIQDYNEGPFNDRK